MRKFIIPNSSYFAAVKDMLLKGQSVVIPVRGQSMLPFLHDGQRVQLKVIAADRLSYGDIVLAEWNNNIILHRLVKKNERSIWLAGDNNVGQLEKINIAQVLAVVTGTYSGDQRLCTYRWWNKWMGMLWYYLRIPRIVIKKIKL